MSHGFIYRVSQNQALTYSTRPVRRHLLPEPKVTEASRVVPVHVRIRQQDVGVLYESSGGIHKVPLATYQAGEHLDCYA